MFIERRSKRPSRSGGAKRADLANSSLQTLRSAGARVLRFIAESINIRLLRSHRVVDCRHGGAVKPTPTFALALCLYVIGVYPRKSAANNHPLRARGLPRFHVPRFVYRPVSINKEESYQSDNKENDQRQERLPVRAGPGYDDAEEQGTHP